MPPGELCDELLEVAVRAAELAAARHRAGLGAGEVGTKSSITDPVTQVDHDSEKIVVESILSARPCDAVLGEEGTDRPGTSGIRWIVDPLDGTVNYLYRYPAHAVSIAAELDDRVVVGVVIDSALDITYSAVLGRGAECDGARLAPRQESLAPVPLVATGFGYDSDQRREQARVLAQLITDIRDIRRGGSAAIDLCSAASGQVDAYFEQGPNEWDVAAGLLICRETGLRTGWDPRAKFVVAAPPGTYEKLNRLLTSADAKVGTAFERGNR